MIIDHDNGIVVATPTKCGKTTIEAMAKSQARRTGQKLEVVRPGQHRLDCPTQAEGYRKLMMVRNPWSRLVSTWSFLANPASKSEQNATLIQGMSFRSFVTWWIDQRWNNLTEWHQESAEVLWSAPARWIMSLSECAEVWEPESVVHIESMTLDLEDAGMDLGPEVQNNTSKKVRPGAWVDYYDEPLFKQVANEHAADDADRFHYEQWGWNINGRYADMTLEELKDA